MSTETEKKFELMYNSLEILAVNRYNLEKYNCQKDDRRANKGIRAVAERRNYIQARKTAGSAKRRRKETPHANNS